MMEIQRHQHRLELGQRPPLADGVRSEGRETDPSHLEIVPKLLHRVRTVVPQIGQRVGRSGRPCVTVGKDEKTIVATFGDDRLELALLVAPGRELAIGPPDREFVPFSDADVVGSRVRLRLLP